MAYSDIPITTAEVNSVAVHTAVEGDRLVGTVLENKQVFDAYPDLIKTHFNALCEYLNGDNGLDYDASEIAYITSVLGCTEASITK
jgi:hypothetical protein